eukprot:10040145-Heterocapsa_arctica.AAC.1
MKLLLTERAMTARLSAVQAAFAALQVAITRELPSAQAVPSSLRVPDPFPAASPAARPFPR